MRKTYEVPEIDVYEYADLKDAILTVSIVEGGESGDNWDAEGQSVFNV